MGQPDTQGTVYGEPATNYSNSGKTAEGNTTIDDTPVLHKANGEPVAPENFIGYHNAGHTDDYLNQHAGLFRVNKPTKEYRVAVARPVAGVTGVIVSNPGLLSGYNFRETNGAAATLRIRSGIDALQPIILTLAIPANGSVSAFLPLSIEYRGGLFLEMVAGNVEGVLFTSESRHA